MVIALSHMNMHNDGRLAKEVPGVDLVLGGHDHDYICETFQHQPTGSEDATDKAVPLIKSATDFLDMS